MNKIAAVGIIRNDDEIIIIKRRTSPRDPWSGQIALPGGHVENNETIVSGVLREIREEVRLNLPSEDIVGEMDPVNSTIAPTLDVYPYIINCNSLDEATPGPEVSELRVVHLLNFKKDTTPSGKPALNYDGWYVWGMTYRILTQYIQGNFRVYKK